MYQNHRILSNTECGSSVKMRKPVWDFNFFVRFHSNWRREISELSLTSKHEAMIGVLKKKVSNILEW